MLLPIVFSGRFDAMAVTSILPFMAVIGNPDLIETNPWHHRLFFGLGFTSTQTFLVGLGVGGLVILVVSNLVSLDGSTAIVWFSSRLGHRSST